MNMTTFNYQKISINVLRKIFRDVFRTLPPYIYDGILSKCGNIWPFPKNPEILCLLIFSFWTLQNQLILPL